MANFPVGRVNAFKPLGHSGQPKLHAVVGSILTVNGFPHTIGLRIILEMIKEKYSLNKFHIRRKERYFKMEKVSFIVDINRLKLIQLNKS